MSGCTEQRCSLRELPLGLQICKPLKLLLFWAKLKQRHRLRCVWLWLVHSLMAFSNFFSWKSLCKLHKFDCFGCRNLLIILKCMRSAVIVTRKNTVFYKLLDRVIFFAIRDLGWCRSLMHLLAQMNSEKFQTLAPVLHRNFRRDCETIFKIAKLHLDFTVLLEIPWNEIESGSFLHSILFLCEGSAEHAHRIGT